MTIDIEFYIDTEHKLPLSKVLSEKGFLEKKTELVADINSDMLSFVFSGGAAILFSVIANVIYDNVLKSHDRGSNDTLPIVEVTIINEHGEERIIVDGKQKMQSLKLETEGSFISIRMK